MSDVEALRDALLEEAQALHACLAAKDPALCILQRYGLGGDWSAVRRFVEDQVAFADGLLVAAIGHPGPRLHDIDDATTETAGDVLFTFCVGTQNDAATWHVMAPNGWTLTLERVLGASYSGNSVTFSFGGEDVNAAFMGPAPWIATPQVGPGTAVPVDGTWSIWLDRGATGSYACDGSTGRTAPVELSADGASVCFVHASSPGDKRGLNDPFTWNQHRGSYTATRNGQCTTTQSGDVDATTHLDPERSVLSHRYYADHHGGSWDPEGVVEYAFAQGSMTFSIGLSATASSSCIGHAIVCTATSALPGMVSVFEERMWYHLNDQHSTIALTNDTGFVLEAYEYSPYGLPYIYTPGANGEIDWGGDDIVLQGGTSPLGNRVLYTGRSWDEDAGLHYYRTRYMSPEFGRFISSDTIGVWGDAANLGNGYAYVTNSPYDSIDPTGMQTAEPCQYTYYEGYAEPSQSCGGNADFYDLKHTDGILCDLNPDYDHCPWEPEPTTITSTDIDQMALCDVVFPVASLFIGFGIARWAGFAIDAADFALNADSVSRGICNAGFDRIREQEERDE